jgi:hypothetical protein
MTDYGIKLVITAFCGIAVYFGLWLCGMPVKPWGYLGAVLIALALLHVVWIMIKSARDGEL